MGGILSRIERSIARAQDQRAVPGPDDDYWYRDRPFPSGTGLVITPETAMGVSTVLSCMRILTGTLASLPLILYRRLGRGKERASDDRLYRKLHDAPNRYQTSFEWREMMEGHALLRGKAYSEIVYGPDYEVDQLIPLHPDRVTETWLPSGRPRYEYRERNGGVRTLLWEQVFRLQGPMGLSVISAARETIGLAAAAESFGAKMFGSRPMLAGVLSHPAKLSPEAAKRIAADFREANAGPTNWHRVAVLEEGMNWQNIGMTAEDAQFLETRKYQKEEIASLFGVPLVLLQAMEKSTSWGSGIEQLMLGFVTITERPRLVAWEQTISRDLVPDPDLFVEFNLDALLRGDLKTRYEAHQIAINCGILNVNEVREIENLNPREAGDEYLRPANTRGPAGQLP